jgi:antitoxin HigA-1
MESLPNITLGEILLEDFLKPLNMTPYRLAKELRISQTRLENILDGKRAVTPDTAMRLARYFNMTPEFFLRLQMRFDLEEIERDEVKQAEYALITPRPAQEGPIPYESDEDAARRDANALKAREEAARSVAA